MFYLLILGMTIMLVAGRLGVVTPPRRMQNGENEEKEESIGQLIVTIVTPLLWPMENGEWRMEITHESTCGKDLCFVHMLGLEVRFLIHHAHFVVWISY